MDKQTEKQVNDKLNIKASISSIVVAFILFALKIIVGLFSQSVAIIASALDSAFDLLSSVANFFAIKHAQKPADQMHRYGHGKAEALAGFIQSIIIFLSGLFLIINSIQRVLFPKEIQFIESSIIVMIISIILTFLLTEYQKYVQKKSKSLVIAADRLHYLTDILSNLIVLASLLLNKYLNYVFFDPIAAILIALYIIFGITKIFKQSFDILMDRDISSKYREDLIKVISKLSPEVIGYHDLRSRSGGDIDFIEFHLEIPKNMTVNDSHILVEKTMYELLKIHRNLEIIIHTDPAEIDSKNGKVKLYDREQPRFY